MATHGPIFCLSSVCINTLIATRASLSFCFKAKWSFAATNPALKFTYRCCWLEYVSLCECGASAVHAFMIDDDGDRWELLAAICPPRGRFWALLTSNIPPWGRPFPSAFKDGDDDLEDREDGFFFFFFFFFFLLFFVVFVFWAFILVVDSDSTTPPADERLFCCFITFRLTSASDNFFPFPFRLFLFVFDCIQALSNTCMFSVSACWIRRYNVPICFRTFENMWLWFSSLTASRFSLLSSWISLFSSSESSTSEADSNSQAWLGLSTASSRPSLKWSTEQGSPRIPSCFERSSLLFEPVRLRLCLPLRLKACRSEVGDWRWSWCRIP